MRSPRKLLRPRRRRSTSRRRLAARVVQRTHRPAALRRRPRARQLRREGEAGRFDLLLVYRVDRVARSVRELEQIIERLDEAGVLFRSATEPFDTSSPAGRMMGADARRLRRVRTRDDRRARHRRYGTQAARGEWAAGQVPYGYRRDSRLQFRVPEPAEVPLVRIIFERYADRMEGAQSIARWLAERGYRTRRGAPFDPKAVLTICATASTSARSLEAGTQSARRRDRQNRRGA